MSREAAGGESPGDGVEAMRGPALPGPPVTRRQWIAAVLVHVYTATGIAFAFLAAVEICREQSDPRWVFVWLIVAVLVDSTDGPLARACHVKTRAPEIDGRKLDDIIDYFTFTFLPLLLVWRMGWIPEPWSVVLIVPALIASLFGFANVGAKQEEEGFFRGFPSYWNMYAFYAGIWHAQSGPWLPAFTLAALTVLTVAPVRFVYPNLAPHPWRIPVLAGGLAWTVLVLIMLPRYPQASPWLLWPTYAYVAFYVGVSIWLDWHSRRRAQIKAGAQTLIDRPGRPHVNER